ncbi:hypothetical protein N7475_006624, partial [Penicillium sp. IBT 31633x]
ARSNISSSHRYCKPRTYPSSPLFLPLSHFFILLTPLSYTHRRPLSFTLAPTDYCAFAFSPTHCLFHFYRICRSIRHPACNAYHL